MIVINDDLMCLNLSEETSDDLSLYAGGIIVTNNRTYIALDQFQGLSIEHQTRLIEESEG